MKSFKQHIKLQESSTTAAFDMEKVIVSAAGGPKFKSKLINNSDKVGEKIIKSLKLSGKGSFPKNSYPATSEWNTYFGPGGAKGSTLTPKTDLLVGNKRISLKTGDAQLMSGGPPEARATFYSAAKKSGTLKTQLIKEYKQIIVATNYKNYPELTEENTQLWKKYFPECVILDSECVVKNWSLESKLILLMFTRSGT